MLKISHGRNVAPINMECKLKRINQRRVACCDTQTCCDRQTQLLFISDERKRHYA